MKSCSVTKHSHVPLVTGMMFSVWQYCETLHMYWNKIFTIALIPLVESAREREECPRIDENDKHFHHVHALQSKEEVEVLVRISESCII
jgi:hypothetical protein